MPDDRRWSADEIAALIRLWATKVFSYSQIAARLGRPRNGISGMLHRLRLAGVITEKPNPGGAGKVFAVNPRVGQMRPKRDNVSKNKGLAAIPPPPKFHRVSAPLTTDPCSLIELEPWQCHWPLGDLFDPPRLFCGAPSLDGLPYCAHHHFRAVQSSHREQAA